MKNFIIEALEQSNFSSRYINLCNDYTNVDNGATFKKNDLLRILNGLDIDLTYSSNEKLFYKDYEINDSSIRFILPFKYGFIDCSYTIWNILKEFRIGGSFANFSLMIDKAFESKVTYKFPIATSMEDLEFIVKNIIQLHGDFIGYLIKKL